MIDGGGAGAGRIELSTHTIYVYLPEEAVDCWVPMRAEHLGGDVYRILDTRPDDEAPEFRKGDEVRCRVRTLVAGITPHERLVAFARAG